MNEIVLQQILSEVKGLNVRFDRVEADIGELKADVAGLKTDVAELKKEVAGLKTDVAGLKAGQAELKKEVGTLKTDVASLQAGQTELFQMVSALRHGQEMTHSKLEGLTLDVRRLEGNFYRFEKKWEIEVTEIRSDIRFLNRRIADVELDVEKLKNR